MSPAEYGELGEGAHLIEVRAIDRAGNVDGSPALFGWSIDLTPPETAVDSGPVDPSNSSSAEFAFSADEDATFQCSLDGASFAACSSPASFLALAEGAHTFHVRAVDRAGNVDASQAAFGWVIDVTPPETAVDSGPVDPSNSSSAELAFSADEDATFECSLDGAPYEVCSSPASYEGLAEGGHAFDVRATDRAGNIDPAPARAIWTVDLTPPETTVESGPANPTNQTSASLEFSADELSSFECSLDGGSFSPCSSAAEYHDLAEGEHAFAVRAIDRAGNVEVEATVFAWRVDLTPPQTSIDGSPPDPSNSSAASFELSADEEATFACSLDGGPFEDCSSPKRYEDLAEGVHSFEVRATDSAGNADASAAASSWTIDLTPPETTIDAQPVDPTKSTTAGFEFSADEASSFECSLDGAAYAACSSPLGYEGLTEGAHALDVRAVDRAGNADPTPARSSWTIDLTPPETTIDEQPADPTAGASAAFVFSTGELSSFECRLDGGAFVGCASPASYEGLAEGRHRFEVRATDRAGNVEPSAASAEWTVDLTAPQTAIDSGPADPSNSSSAEFALSANEEGTFVCSLDGAPFSDCSSPAGYDGLAEGLHTFEVRAIDRAGNVDAEPAVFSWTIDLTPPDTSLDARPGDPTASTSADFAFSSDEAASFECRLDDESFAPCSSPQRHKALAEGGHAFDVRAIDGAGNVDPSPARAVWTIDLTPPQSAITEQPSDPTSSSSARFAVGANEQATFTCSLDGVPFVACSPPMSYDGLAEGRHTFEVRATDGVGNVELTPASYSWTVDQTAPETTIDAGPPDPTNSTSASFDFSSDEPGSTFVCSLDGSPFAACSSTAHYSGLEPGAHSFSVRATDPAGNSDATPTSRSWTIDVAAPETVIDSGPADPTNTTSASFELSADEAAVFECRLDGGSFGACTSQKSYEGLAEGTHVFDVRAIDAAGNADPTPARFSWTIDLTPPQTTIDAGPPDPTNSTSASFELSAGEAGATLECALDGAPFSPCSSPAQYAGLAPGAHELQVKATDRAGNSDPSPARHAWVIDTAAPQTTIDAGPGTTASTSATLRFSASEPGSTFVCSLDGAAFAPCASPREYSGLAEGVHEFRVRATDRAGNTDPTPASHVWEIDRTPPQTTIDSGPPATTTSTSADFEFSAGESGSTFECSLDGSAFTTCSSPLGYVALAGGGHEFRVRATDLAGNTDASPAVRSWTIEPPPDQTVPETTIDESPPALSTSSSASFRFSSSKPSSTFECSLDGAGFAVCVSPRQYTGLANGGHQFRVRARDSAGNLDQTPAAHSWTVDTVAPQTTITGNTPPVLTSSANASFSFTSNEVGSTFECSLDAATFVACSPPRQYTNLADGAHQFRVRATDAAGNADQSPAAHSWTVDTVAPETTVTVGPPSTTTSTSASFEFSANQTGSTFECSLDTAAFAACTSPRQYTGLALGQHQFRVRARDTAGNLDQSPATLTWTITAPSATCPAPMTLSAVADAWIDENSPSTNKGSDSILKVQSKGPRDNFRTVVRFPQPPLPSGCVVDTATLRLFAASMKSGRVLHALRLAAGWAENSVSWANQPPTAGAAATTSSGFGYREWDVRSQVQVMFSESVSHGFLIRDAAEGADAEQQLHSREKGQSPPQLVIRFAATSGG